MRNIALFMGLNDSYEHGIARGVIRNSRGRGDVRLHGYGWMFAGIHDIESWRGDGIIARVENRHDATLLGSLGIPVVDVAGAYTAHRFRNVTNDDRATGATAATHLLSRGFSRFAYCGVEGARWSSLRFEGFRSELAKSNAEFDRESTAESKLAGALPTVQIFDAPLEWWEQPERTEGLREWLPALDRPVALFACNDTAGLKITALCRELAIRVPEEVAVLGVDDEDIPCELSTPPLSSIPLDCEQIGFRAADLLLSIVDGAPLADGSRIGTEKSRVVPPFEPVERESTAVYVSDDSLVRRAGLFIRNRAAESIGVADVAAAVAASRRTLELHFRRATGRTVHEEITGARLARAAALLRENRETIVSIAERCGFQTPSRFYRIFGERYGCTPGAYRARHGGGRG